MVKIKTNSWHYRWLTFLTSGDYPSTNSLCVYFWWFIFLNFIVAAVVFGVVLVLLVTYLLWCDWGNFITFGLFSEYRLFLGFLPPILVGSLMYLTFFLSGKPLGKKITSQLGDTGELVSTVSESFFNKYCPKIEYLTPPIDKERKNE